MARTAPAAVTFTAHDRLATLPLRHFTDRFARVLPGLIRFLRSEELRRHPKWGKFMPFDVAPYGKDASLGHICRPDIILTDQGPRITEIDFVPSGRGWTMMGIPSSGERRLHLEAYRQWYAGMGYGVPNRPVYYATGSTTVCREETDLFAAGMRQLGIAVQSVNIDSDQLDAHGLVDRLFYRAELARPLRRGTPRIITAEPWLDSKMVFAVVHDTTMTNVLTKYVGADGLAFLREVLIRTYLLEDIVRRRGEALTRLIENRSNYVLKSTEVEEPWSWGARSVVIGSRMGRNNWEVAVRFAAGNPPRKELGRHPIVQPFCQSKDFGALWNGVVNGQLATPDPVRFGKPVDSATTRPAKSPVYARVGIYFLVNNRAGRVHVPPHGVLTLRQDPLAHGASDAIITAFKIA